MTGKEEMKTGIEFGIAPNKEDPKRWSVVLRMNSVNEFEEGNTVQIVFPFGTFEDAYKKIQRKIKELRNDPNFKKSTLKSVPNEEETSPIERAIEKKG